MDSIKPVYAILSTIVDTIQVCQDNGDFDAAWNSERRFCDSLRSTLDTIDASLPIDQNFTHDHELNFLIHAILQPLTSFYVVVAPCMTSLQQVDAPTTSRRIQNFKVYLTESVIQPVQTLRRQLRRYLQGVDTLLLLYAIDILYSASPKAITEQQLEELQVLERKAGAIPSQGLIQLMSSTSAKSLSLKKPQELLVSVRQHIHHHWERVEMIIHLPWSDAADDYITFTNVGGHDQAASELSRGQQSIQGSNIDDHHATHELKSPQVPVALVHQNFPNVLSQKHGFVATNIWGLRVEHLDPNANDGTESPSSSILPNIAKRNEYDRTNNPLHPPKILHDSDRDSGVQTHQASHNSTLSGANSNLTKLKSLDELPTTSSDNQSLETPQKEKYQIKLDRVSGSSSVRSSHGQPEIVSSTQPRHGAYSSQHTYQHGSENHNPAYRKPINTLNTQSNSSILGSGDTAAPAGGGPRVGEIGHDTTSANAHESDMREGSTRRYSNEGDNDSNCCCIIL